MAQIQSPFLRFTAAEHGWRQQQDDVFTNGNHLGPQTVGTNSGRQNRKLDLADKTPSGTKSLHRGQTALTKSERNSKKRIVRRVIVQPSDVAVAHAGHEAPVVLAGRVTVEKTFTAEAHQKRAVPLRIKGNTRSPAQFGHPAADRQR